MKSRPIRRPSLVESVGSREISTNFSGLLGNVYPFTKVLSTNDFVVIAQGPSPDITQTFKVLHVEVLPQGCR
jgi:hypothetical protein